jgi:argininosuccinate synthase
MSPKKVVLAYSGGLDTSIIIPWLKENYGFEVHTVCGDVGQGDDELDGLEKKARATGAASCRIVDLKREFLTEYVWPCLRAMTVYEGRYLLGTSMARPILAKAQVDYAREIGATHVAHGCTGKGNDQVRFELTYMALAPDLEIVAPWREWSIKSREDAIDYAESRKIPITASRAKIYSRDRNLWHISHEGGALEDPANAPPEDVWMLTVSPEKAPDKAHVVRIGYERGVPVSIDGRALAPEALVAELNALGGKHGVGRIDITENRLVGMKSRGVYETPGGTILLEGLRTLRALTLDRDTLRMCEKLMPEYADIVYTGRWFAPLRESLDAFFARATEPVTGEVHVKLFKGQATALSAKSPHSLYSEDLATFGESASFDHADSKGFVRLYGLPGMVAASVKRKTSGDPSKNASTSKKAASTTRAANATNAGDASTPKPSKSTSTPLASSTSTAKSSPSPAKRKVKA